MYGRFFNKRNTSGIRKPSDPVKLLEAVAEIREKNGTVVDLSKALNNRDDDEAVRKTMGWLVDAGNDYPEFATALELPVPADRENALMPGKQGRKKVILSDAQKAALAARLGLATK